MDDYFSTVTSSVEELPDFNDTEWRELFGTSTYHIEPEWSDLQEELPLEEPPIPPQMVKSQTIQDALYDPTPTVSPRPLPSLSSSSSSSFQEESKPIYDKKNKPHQSKPKSTPKQKPQSKQPSKLPSPSPSQPMPPTPPMSLPQYPSHVTSSTPSNSWATAPSRPTGPAPQWKSSAQTPTTSSPVVKTGPLKKLQTTIMLASRILWVHH